MFLIAIVDSVNIAKWKTVRRLADSMFHTHTQTNTQPVDVWTVHDMDTFKD